MTPEELTERIVELFPDWDDESVARAVVSIDATAMEASVEADIAALPTFGMEDGMTLDQRVSTLKMSELLTQKDRTIETLADLLGTWIDLATRQTQMLVRREEEIALLLEDHSVRVPALDESWRQERNGRFL